MSKYITRTVTITRYNIFSGTEFIGTEQEKITKTAAAEKYQKPAKTIAVIPVQTDPVLVGMPEEDFLAAAYIMETPQKMTKTKYQTAETNKKEN